MAAWADYLISAVSYDRDRRIVQVRQHRDTGDGIGNEEIIDRSTLAHNLKKGASYATIFGSNASWKLGDRVNLIRMRGSYAIRTDSNKAEIDNLKFVAEL